MPRRFGFPTYLASGTGIYDGFTALRIKLIRFGCPNRPFYHITVTKRLATRETAPIEQLGTYDPIPNENNEQMVSLNFERLKYWLGRKARASDKVEELLGLAGFYPIHPRTYMSAWRNRRKIEEKEKAKAATEEKAESSA